MTNVTHLKAYHCHLLAASTNGSGYTEAGLVLVIRHGPKIPLGILMVCHQQSEAYHICHNN